MVFGFGEGKMELVLPKTAFAFGEMIEGKIKLELKKDKQAKKLRVVLEAIEERTQYSSGTRMRSRGPGIRTRSSVGGVSRDTVKTILYTGEVIVDGEKLYPAGMNEYDFKIQVPQSSVMPSKAEIGGNLGKAIGALQMLSGAQNRVKWELRANLDASGKDIAKQIQISIG
ncbi:MAG: hypothetical protein JW772_01150 [Candidatus Diapherotrites archaeon]|nr:hypothetical protein [Candidatus Diapherotrites archaeon]